MQNSTREIEKACLLKRIYIYSMPSAPQANTDKYALAHICIGNGRNDGGKKDRSLSLPREKLTRF